MAYNDMPTLILVFGAVWLFSKCLPMHRFQVLILSWCCLFTVTGDITLVLCLSFDGYTSP